MPNFKITSSGVITLDNKRWSPSTKFHSKDRFVDENGKAVSSDYKGTIYRIIEKRERTFSNLERIGRGFQGTLAIVCTLCLALFSKSVRNLFTKSKTNDRFGVPEKLTRFKVEQGKLVYPHLLFNGTKILKDLELNFALVNVGGTQQLLPVISTYKEYKTHKNPLIEALLQLAQDKEKKPKEYRTYEGSALEALLQLAQDKEKKPKEYRTYEGSALEALLQLAQDKEPIVTVDWHEVRHYGSPIGHVLKHPNNSMINEEEFLKFILEKDRTGIPRICTLNSARTLLEVLNFIKEKNIKINLNDKTPEGETVFTLWAGKGIEQVTGIMLELDPSVIEQTQGQIKSAFVEATLNSSKGEADILINAMEKKGIVLSPEEIWIKRAFKNDCEFSEEEFTQLDQELKIKIFFVANAYANENIVKKLKLLGMDEVPLFWPGPHIFASNMDIVTARNVIESFLKGLKKEGLLLTEEEFSKLDKSKYISKTDAISRIQGRNFIARLAKENELTHIKVPKKIVVINDGIKEISFYIAESLELIPKGDQRLTIYAERVKPVDRELTLEEAIEFMIILEKTGYMDIGRQNFIVAEDGIYFIDTEFKDFSPTKPRFDSIKTIWDPTVEALSWDPNDGEKFLAEYEKRRFDSIKTIANLLHPNDKKTFLAEYEKRKEAYENSKKIRDEQEAAYCKAFKNPYKNLTDGYQRQRFNFQVGSL